MAMAGKEYCLPGKLKNYQMSFFKLHQKLRSEELQSTQSLEAFTAKTLMPLDKNSVLRQNGVAEVLRRIAGTAVMMLDKKDVKKASGSLLPSAGQNAGAEDAIYAMKDIFVDIDTNTVSF